MKIIFVSHNTKIRYDEIQSIKMIKDKYLQGVRKIQTGLFSYKTVEEPPKGNFLEITFKDGSSKRFNLSNYSFKKNTILINYLGKFADLYVSQEIEFLNTSEKQDKMELKIAIKIILICLIIGAFLMWEQYKGFWKTEYKIEKVV